jgi:hypothetical protein
MRGQEGGSWELCDITELIGWGGGAAGRDLVRGAPASAAAGECFMYGLMAVGGVVRAV